MIEAKIPGLKRGLIKEKKSKTKEDLNDQVDFTDKDYNAEEGRAFLLGDLITLKKGKTVDEEYIERSKKTYVDLKDFFINMGAQEISDVSLLYGHYISKQEKLVVRREDPERVVNLVYGEDFVINFDPKVVADRGDKYANCAIWPYGANPVGGIANSFLEGRGMAGPIVTLIAIKPRDEERLKIEEPEGKIMNIGTLSRESVKILSGTIKKSDLEFVVVRVANKFFPPEFLTEREKKDNPSQVFRGFIFSKKMGIEKNKLD